MAIGNSLGTGFYKKKPIVDIDAQEFFDVALIADNTEKSALSNLSDSLKNNGLWGKLDIIYPFIGGLSTPHSFNLKNPSQHQITWNGSITHNSDGITGDGSTGYGNTGYVIPNLQTNSHVSVYIRNNILAPQYQFAFGTYLPDEGGDSIIGARFASGSGATSFSIANQTSLYTETTTKRFLSINRLGDELSLYRDGSLFNSSTNLARIDNNLPLYLLGANFRDTSLLEPGTFNIAFFTSGKNLTTSEQLELYNTIQEFQTTLSRQN